MNPTASKILDGPGLAAALQDWRDKHSKIVFTNGCFDILHLGHVDYLERARSLGDRLIVGLNSDASVRRLKGPERPIQDEQARARIMAALAFVDAVVIFGEDTPHDLILRIMPDVLVKGGDYTPETVVGAAEVQAAGGQLVLLSFVPGHSTTSIVHKMRKDP